MVRQRLYANREGITVIRSKDENTRDKEQKDLLAKCEVFDYKSLPIPRRPDWNTSMTKEELEAKEQLSFLNWRRSLAHTIESSEDLSVTPYEKNLNMWRQLWRVVEKCDILIQIVDVRNPLAYYSKDLTKYVHEISGAKRCILLINKADFLSKPQRQAWATYFKSQNIEHIFFSALKEQLDQDLLSDANREKLTDLQMEVLNSNVKKSQETETDIMDGRVLT
eukprot:UN27048